MHRAWPALALLLCSVARGQALSYSAAGIVNAANFAPGPFAPNSVVTIFGSGLSLIPTGVSAPQTVGSLPINLANVSVIVQNIVAPLLYVSPTQINFLIPAELIGGTATVCVVRQGLAGSTVNINLVPGAPALFPYGNGYALAVDWNHASSLITPDAPAHSGDVIILYVTGLGAAGYMASGLIPGVGAEINNLSSLKVYLGGVAIDPKLILYAGLTPGWAGLYQINMILPADLPNDPEIRVAIGNQSSLAGVKLAVR